MAVISTPLPTRLFSVSDYHRMIAAGIFGPEERIELVFGQLIPMAAKGAPHSSTVSRTRFVLEDCLPLDQVLIRIQEPIILDDFSEPEPDLALVRPDPSFYAQQHPGVADVFLVIEVADSSLKYYREVKSKAYARAGIQDYWVVNIPNQQLHVYRSPQLQSPQLLSSEDSGYGVELTLAISEQVRLWAFPDCEIAVAALFG